MLLFRSAPLPEITFILNYSKLSVTQLLHIQKPRLHPDIVDEPADVERQFHIPEPSRVLLDPLKRFNSILLRILLPEQPLKDGLSSLLVYGNTLFSSPQRMQWRL
jgi:hypothetical protein